MSKGYLFACTEKSEAECFDRHLFGTSHINQDGVMAIDPDDELFLVNLDSDTLYGPFTAKTRGGYNLVPDAWNGNYPYQVCVNWPKQVKCVNDAKRILKSLGLRSNILMEDYEVDAVKDLVNTQFEISKSPFIGSNGSGEPQAMDVLLKQKRAELRESRKTAEKRAVINKPKMEATTLWDFPTQSYGDTPKGNNKYPGVTPAFIIWNLVRRYTNPGDLVVDPMCGSGTTIDVCNEEGRRVKGFDIVPTRSDIEQNDARNIPLDENTVDLVFIDSPYGDNIKYNDHADSIGNISAEDEKFYDDLELVMKEAHRILKPGKALGWLIGDQWVKKMFTPVGFKIYERLTRHFEPVDIICVTRRSQSSNTGIWYNRALRFNFYLRGFKYLIVVRKPSKDTLKVNGKRNVNWTYYDRNKLGIGDNANRG